MLNVIIYIIFWQISGHLSSSLLKIIIFYNIFPHLYITNFYNAHYSYSLFYSYDNGILQKENLHHDDITLHIHNTSSYAT